jgi:hypothetical protein
MSAKSKSTVPEERLQLYRKLVATVPGVELKGASMPYTSVNGHMFSFLDKEGNLALRLPEMEREAFIKAFRTSLCEAHGTVLKEYVSVPEEAFADTKRIAASFRQSHKYVSAMKPKPTKRS